MGKVECDYPPLIKVRNNIECTPRRFRLFKDRGQCARCDGFIGSVLLDPRKTKAEIAFFEIRDRRRFIK